MYDTPIDLVLPTMYMSLAIPEDHAFVRVVGNPGSGKTVLMRYLARQVHDSGRTVRVLSGKQDKFAEYDDIVPDAMVAGPDGAEARRLVSETREGDYLLIDLPDYFAHHGWFSDDVRSAFERGAVIIAAGNIAAKDGLPMANEDDAMRAGSVMLLGRLSRRTVKEAAPWLTPLRGLDIPFGQVRSTVSGVRGASIGLVPFIAHEGFQDRAWF